MSYLPITLNLTDKVCLIVGGGQVALRKLSRLLSAQATVRIVAPEICYEIEELAKHHSITLIREKFSATYIAEVDLVIAATNDNHLNAEISHLAQAKHIWVNVVDDSKHCSFISPAIIDRAPLLIAISTGGVAPVLARKIRERIEWILPKNLGHLLDQLKQLRPQIKNTFSNFKLKRSFAEWFIERAIEHDEDMEKSFPELVTDFEKNISKKGQVFLIGAGPGDPDLLTIKALKVLQKADVVLHDALVSKDIMQLIRRDAELVSVGKRARKHSVQQAEINQLLIRYAKQGLTVVRLKGGDPFIFGRGGEELEELVQANIDFQVVPGITAASGCATYAGIPLTHRDYAQTVMFITAHCKNSEDTMDWASIAKHKQTVAVYMGLMRNEVLMQQLIKYGRLASTPVAVIENGTLERQRVVIGELKDLPNMIIAHQVKTPALIVIGEVVALAKKLNWYKSGSMFHYQPQLLTAHTSLAA